MQELVKRAQAGDIKAFERLVVRFQRRIYGYAFNRIHNHADSEELVQETFLRAFSNIKTLKKQSKFSLWLFAICRNCVLEKLRKKQHECITESLEYISTEEEQEIKSEWESYFDTLRIAINRLKPHLQKVIQLRYFTGLSHRSISNLLSIPESRVKSRLYEAKQKMRELLPYLSEGVSLTSKQIMRETEEIMKSVEFMKMGASIFERLSLYQQVQICSAVEDTRRFGDELLEAIGRIKNGSEFVKNCEARLTLHELVGILGRVCRETEFRLISELDEIKPEFSESIKQNMMVFEDFVLADKAAIRKVIERIENTIIKRALVCCQPDVKKHFLNALTDEEKKCWKDDILNIVLTEVPDSDEAQEFILYEFFEMMREGEIQVVRDDSGVHIKSSHIKP